MAIRLEVGSSKRHISPLEHRLVLDVGCGNGISTAGECWAPGQKMVVGIDPLLLNVMQFQLV